MFNAMFQENTEIRQEKARGCLKMKADKTAEVGPSLVRWQYPHNPIFLIKRQTPEPANHNHPISFLVFF